MAGKKESKMKPGPAYILPYRKEIKAAPAPKPTPKATPKAETWLERLGQFVDRAGDKLGGLGKEAPKENPYMKRNSLYKPPKPVEGKPKGGKKK